MALAAGTPAAPFLEEGSEKTQYGNIRLCLEAVFCDKQDHVEIHQKSRRKNGIRHEKSLEDLGDTYGGFSDTYAELFRSGNHSVVKTAQQYLCGLMQAEKRNMERMAEAVPDSDDQVLQKF